MQSSLSTDRLLLRPWATGDADFVYDMYSRWEVQRYLGRVPRVLPDLAEALAMIERWKGLDDPVHGIWAIERTQDRQLVGTLLLKSIPASGELPLVPSGDTEIGWHLHPDFWGQGYATEAASTVLEMALASGLEQVVAVTNPANTASAQVCRRIGLDHAGQTDRYYNTTCELFVTSPG
ncbi:GNAT family N-acetyltransferase [Arthrobacter sp.]|uniref:GNAT family N-acetyltransferase n=1 Tax=Arthrobacter sp. TaxID=1667 RepID=UPI0028967B40|nr:GNAT family N-acetyltransferase [Arthrobacter sp.]